MRLRERIYEKIRVQTIGREEEGEGERTGERRREGGYGVVLS